MKTVCPNYFWNYDLTMETRSSRVVDFRYFFRKETRRRREHASILLAAALAGMVAVGYTHLVDLSFTEFLAWHARHRFLSLASVPYASGAVTSVTRCYFPGAKGSGITRVIAYALPLPLLAVLSMAGLLATVTRTPIMSFVVVAEMNSAYSIAAVLIATALISSRICQSFHASTLRNIVDALSPRS